MYHRDGGWTLDRIPHRQNHSSKIFLVAKKKKFEGLCTYSKVIFDKVSHHTRYNLMM
jgi:hypothetical protein